MRPEMPPPSRVEKVLAIVLATISTWLMAALGVTLYLPYLWKSPEGWVALFVLFVALVPASIFWARDGLRIVPPLGRRRKNAAMPALEQAQPSNTTPHTDARDVPAPAKALGARAGGRER